MDHIVQQAAAGGHALEDVALCCKSCNQERRSRFRRRS
ncbi:MAG: HNH endonuclease [Verrucomicrobia bacterium]|nr:HNH endonuclease [Verrucomicrobiota bacterium]